jgi:iron(III) transport system permease protein
MVSVVRRNFDSVTGQISFKLMRRRDYLPGIMISAAVIASIAVFTLLVTIVWLSFVDGSPGDDDLAYTFGHYASIFLDDFTYQVIINTLMFSSITLLVALSLGLPMAWIIERTDFPGKPIVFTMFTIALLIPGFSVALGWVFLLHPRIGIVNQALMTLFGLEEAPFNIATILGMGMVEGLSLTPVTFIMTAIVFRAMDPSMEEAAAMGGANLRERMRRVTLPLAWPGILAASIYVFAIGFAAFDVPAIIGLPQRIFTFSTYVYSEISPADGLPEYGGVAGLSVIMVLFAVALTWWYNSVQRNSSRYAVVTGKAYRPTLVELGRYKIPVICLFVIFFTLSQAVPVLTLLWGAGLPFLQPVSAAAIAQLSFNNFTSLPGDLVFSGIQNTGMLMILVPTITVALSLGISWVVLRSKVPGRSIFDFFAFLPHTIPSIVFSVAAWLLALFVLSDFIPIYGTIWILVLVYVIARLSYGTRMTNTGMIQIHKELEESARMSGASSGGVMRGVVIPLLTPAMMYAWIWIALLTYRELTLPVVLSTGDNQPLSMVVWSLVLTSEYGHASAVAVIMMALMIPILILYWVIVRRTQIVPTS